MTPITFKRWRPTSPEYTLILEHIAYWCEAHDNGQLVTIITMVDGENITVGNSPHEVKQLFGNKQ
jgi:hypothetical protein